MCLNIRSAQIEEQPSPRRNHGPTTLAGDVGSPARRVAPLRARRAWTRGGPHCLLGGELVLGASPALARDPSGAWARLKGLVGTWQRSDAPASTPFRIRYRLISADTALVEEFGDPARQVTQTVFHLDGKHVLATHYCAQGNQPRLRLRPDSSTDALVFAFLDATNLRSPTDSHLVRLSLRWLDADHLSRQEVYAANGKEEVGTLLLQRSR